jgi:Mg2+ and Co2+ transporter CorA
LSESTTDNDFSTQNEGSDEVPTTADNNIESINGEKTVRKSKTNVKIEDYDLIVNSLKDATTSFKDVILSISKKAQEIRDKAEETFTVGAKRDARDIQALGSHVENVVKGFEETMADIKKRNYADEEKLLKGYKKLLEEQINLINARIELVKRLKSK